MSRPGPARVRENSPRAAKCGSPIASETLATMQEQMSLPAKAVRHSSAVREPMMARTAAIVPRRGATLAEKVMDLAFAGVSALIGVIFARTRKIRQRALQIWLLIAVGVGLIGLLIWHGVARGLRPQAGADHRVAVPVGRVGVDHKPPLPQNRRPHGDHLSARLGRH